MGAVDFEKLWLNILRSAMKIPGVKVQRDEFLRRELLKSRLSAMLVDGAVSSNPIAASIPINEIDKIADRVIGEHTTVAVAFAAGAGIPGGWWMAATIPADMAQFYWHALQVMQKLAYLYGWGDIFSEGEDMDEETLLLITVFLGVMFGADSAVSAVTYLANAVAKQALKRIPKMALTKFGLYNTAKQVLKWVGISLTKQITAETAAKVIPFIGAILNGAVTLFTFQPMCKKYMEHMKKQSSVFGASTADMSSEEEGAEKCDEREGEDGSSLVPAT